MIPNDFNTEEFAKNMSEQATEKMPLFIPDNVKTNITKTIYDFIKIGCKALNSEDNVYDTNETVLITQLVAEWMYHKGIDNYVNEIPQEYCQSILQEIAFEIFKTARRCVCINTTQDFIINAVEHCVNQKYFELITQLDKENKLTKSVEDIIKQSNLMDYVNEQEKLSNVKYTFAQENQTEQMDNVFNYQLQNSDNNDFKQASKLQTFILLIICTGLYKFCLLGIKNGLLFTTLSFIFALCLLYFVLIKSKMLFFGYTFERQKKFFVWLEVGLIGMFLMRIFNYPPIILFLLISFLVSYISYIWLEKLFNKIQLYPVFIRRIITLLLFLLPTCYLCLRFYTCYIYRTETNAFGFVFALFVLIFWIIFYILSKVQNIIKK